MSVLMVAVERGKSEIVSLLLHHSQTYVNTTNAKYDSATTIALTKGFLRSLKLLIRCPKTNLTTELERVRKYHESNMEDVLAYQTGLKTLPSTCCLSAKESLLEAAWIGDFRGIRGLLLCPGANINAHDGKGRTLLFLASWLSHKRAVDVLLKNTEVDVNMGKIIDGSSPFAIASVKGHFEIMKKLIKHPNIIEGKGWDSDSWTPHITKTNVFTEPTKTYTTDLTTSPRIGLDLYTCF